MALLIAIDKTGDNVFVQMSGTIDEHAGDGFKSMMGIRNGKVLLDMAQVVAINSIGVRGWLQFMRNFRLTHEVVLVRCPPDVIMQINMIPEFLGQGKVESFSAPYFCADCKEGFQKEFSTSKSFDELVVALDKQPCGKCNADSECDEAPSDFLYFLGPK